MTARSLTQDSVLGRLLAVLAAYRRAERALPRGERLLNRSPRAAVTLALIAGLAAGPAAAADDASVVIEAMMNEVLTVLRDDALTLATKQGRVEQIANERFDFDRISRLVLGRNWRKFSAEQREQFLSEFKRHLSLTYGRRLNRFTEEEVVLSGTQEHPKGDVTVKTRIVGGPADGATIDYRMRRRDGAWYAIDIIIEGVSMIANFRSQIQEIVSAKGADALIETLREKNARESLNEEA